MSDDLPTSGANQPDPDSLSGWPSGVSERLGLTSGMSFGRYRLLRVLGEGGFGVVYEAEQHEPVRRRVALKVIKPGMDSELVITRFEAERQALAVMDHPCIASVFDGGATPPELGSRPYFAMELVKGEPITRFCDVHKLGVAERIQLFMRVCDAVQHAHAKGVIHRDLKPSNILVGFDAEGLPQPKVIDFGVAKAINQRLTEDTIFTAHGQMIGTPEYMSPEQAEMSAVDIDTRSDVYSLGVVLYELLTGALPFDPTTLRRAGLAEIQRIIREVDPPRPSTRLSTARRVDERTTVRESAPDAPTGEIDPDAETRLLPQGGASPAAGVMRAKGIDPSRTTRVLRRDLDWVVMKCLEKNRARRYATASELAAELGRFLKNEPVLAGPPSAWYRARKFVRRNRAGVTAAVLVAIAVVAGLVGTTWGMVWALDERARAQAAEQAEAEQRQVATEVATFLNDDVLGQAAPERGGRQITVLEAVNRSVEQLDARSGADALPTPVEAGVRGVIGETYLRLGRETQAEEQLREAERLLEAAEVPAPIELGRTQRNLAEAVYRQDRVEEAMALAEQAYETLRGEAGEDARLTMNARSMIAACVRKTGDLERSKALYEALHADMVRVFGADDLDAVLVENDIALVETVAGNNDAAIERMSSVVNRLERTEGTDSVYWVNAAGELAKMQFAAGETEAAVALYERVLPVSRKVLGIEARRTLLTLVNLGVIKLRGGDAVGAEPLLAEALAVYDRTRGPTSSESVFIAGQLGTARAMTGDVDAAVKLLEDRYIVLAGAGEEAAPAARSIAGRLAGVLEDTGRREDAARWQTRAAAEASP